MPNVSTLPANGRRSGGGVPGTELGSEKGVPRSPAEAQARGLRGLEVPGGGVELGVFLHCTRDPSGPMSSTTLGASSSKDRYLFARLAAVDDARLIEERKEFDFGVRRFDSDGDVGGVPMENLPGEKVLEMSGELDVVWESGERKNGVWESGTREGPSEAVLNDLEWEREKTFWSVTMPTEVVLLLSGMNHAQPD